jgi:hypothetical protein
LTEILVECYILSSGNDKGRSGMNKTRTVGASNLSVAVPALCLALVLAGLPLQGKHRPSISGAVKLTYLSRILEPSWAWGSEAALCVDQDKLYIPLGYPGLAVYDISLPGYPVRLKVMSSSELGGQAGPVAARGSRAYVGLPDKNLIAVLDVADPSRPRVLTRITGVSDIQQLQVRGSYLYALGGSYLGHEGGIFAFDLSGTTPVPAGQYTTDLLDPGFFITETGTAFLARTPETATDSAKVDCVDMSKPAQPVFKGRWTSSYPGNITDMDLKGSRLYCSAYWGGIWVLDASDVANLKLAASFDWAEPEPYAKSIRAFPPLVFLAQGGPQMADQKFAVFRASGTGLVLWQEISASTYTHSVAMAGNLVFLVEQESPWGNSHPQKIVNLYQIEVALKPPINVALRRDINRSLFFQEAYHTITWQPNPEDAGIDLAGYRVYRKPAGRSDAEYALLGAVSQDTLRYVDSRLRVSLKLEYAVTAVDGEGVESPFSASVKN